MNKLTMQKTLDFVAKKLNEQGRQSKGVVGENEHTSCVYRADNGDKCALGHIMPDEFYSEDFETKVPGRLVKNEDNAFSRWADNADNKEFLTQIQEAHDLAKNAKDLNAKLSAIALNYGLRAPAPVEKFEVPCD